MSEKDFKNHCAAILLSTAKGEQINAPHKRRPTKLHLSEQRGILDASWCAQHCLFGMHLLAEYGPGCR